MSTQPPVDRDFLNQQQSVALLRTKLYIPAPRPQLVPRPRLIERLHAGLHRKLTLISAPAGFGKTTLVSKWVAGQDRRGPKVRIAWLSLDEGDNDPTRFLTYLIASLQEALQIVEARPEPAGNIGQGALSALQSPQPPPVEAILSALINEMIALPDRMVLVLDDYHLIEAQPIHDALTFLLRHLPRSPSGGLHLVLATREDPPLPLARLRARGQLTELRATDLRFTSSEAAAFLSQVMGLDLAAEDIAALETRTEGWIAGLQLAAISLQGHKDVAGFIRSFTGSHRFVLDYLLEEVLEQQSESVQTFLLQTALLDRLTGSLCDAVRFGDTQSPADQDNGQATLKTLEHANLFIVSLDEERRWYRYHHLFADLLRQRLHQTQPERLPILHRRASEWYEQKGFVDEAIDHALRGEYYERAAYLIEDQLGVNYERVDPTTLRRWLAEMPGELVFSRPHLCILHAWSLFTSGQLEGAEQSLRAAEAAVAEAVVAEAAAAKVAVAEQAVGEKMLDPNTGQALVSSLDTDPLSDTNRMKLVGRVAAIRSFMASYGGNSPRTIRYACQALEALPEQELQWRTAALITLGDAYASQGQMGAAHKARSDALVTGKASGDTYILMMVHLRLAEILRQQGKLQQVLYLCERQSERAGKSGLSESAVVGWLFGIWGEVLAELDQLDRAIDQATKGVKLTARSGDVLYKVLSNLCLVRVLFSSGDSTGAQDVIRSVENSARKYELPLWANLQLSAWQVRIWLAQGKLEVASQWVRARELDPDAEPTYLHEVEVIAFARIFIAQGRLDEAARLLRRLREGAETGGRFSRVIEILLLEALAHQAGGDTIQAMTALEQALILAEPKGFIRTFVDEGPSMGCLLYKAAARGIAPDYARRLLTAFPVTEPEQTDSGKTQDSSFALIEPLSERELEVLWLIAEGLTNPEIASRLFLALNTVKGHTRNIYGKLGVHNRTRAVVRARALGLLSPT
jgi:LuxR family maltose regulon positive regulatory protein